MKVTYLDVAVAELEEAIQYYNDQRTGLGFEFWNEVKQAIERIKNYPHAWRPLSNRTRRCLTHRTLSCQVQKSACDLTKWVP